MKQKDFEIIVNMPDCSNIMFYFRNFIITEGVKKPFIESKNALVFYNLSQEIQNQINRFLNPKSDY